MSKTKIPAERRPIIRAFLRDYPWVPQYRVADLFGVSRARISEIVRKDINRSGV